MNKIIELSCLIQAPIEIVWELWTKPKHIVKWNNASEDWHTPYADNELQIGGNFLYRMESKDGKIGFDLKGTYTNIVIKSLIEYILEDGRSVTVNFTENKGLTNVIEKFESENQNSLELQQKGWQAILNNFKKYTEHYHYEQ